MDFPANLLTNLHQADDLDKIFWIKCSIKDLHSTSISQLGTELRILRRRFDIQAQGFHLFVEDDGQIAHIFAFSKQRLQQATTSSLLDGFSVQSTGILNAEDAANTPQDSSNNGKTDPKSGETTSLEGKAMEAIASSICYFLTKSFGWLLVGNRTCIEPVMYPLFGNKSFQFAYEKSSTCISFEPYWSREGRLNILSQVSMSALHAPYQGTSTVPRIEIGQRVILCPLGMLAIYRGVAEKDAFDQVNELAKALNDVGIAILEDMTWLEVAIPGTSDMEGSGLDPGAAILESTYWPARLVLCRESHTLPESKSLLRPSGDSKLDHIGKIEDWLHDKATRAEAAQVLKRELEFNTKRSLPESATIEMERSDNELSPASPLIPIQDVTGIYPTPSDGFPSQGPEGDQSTPAGGVPDHESPALEFASRVKRINGSRQQSYGATDTDMDMFGANDLTEADFNFFDEPDIDEQAAIGTQGFEQNEVGHETIGDKGKGHVSTVKTDSFRHPDRQTTDQKTLEDGKTSTQISKSKKTDLGSSPILRDSLEIEETKKLGIPKLPRKDDHSEVRPVLRHDDRVRGSFDALLLGDLDLDKKYGSEGRFGYYPGDLLPRQKQDDFQGKKRSLEAINASGHEESTQTRNSSSESDTNSDTGDEETDGTRTASRGFKKEERKIFSFPKGIRSPSSVLTKPTTPSSPPSISSLSHRKLKMTNINAADHTLNRANASIENARKETRHFTGSGQSFVQLAQLVADQAATSTVLCPFTEQKPFFDTVQGSQRSATYLVNRAIKEIVPTSRTLSLGDLGSQGGKESLPFVANAEAPHVNIRRVGVRLDVLPSSLPFWEQLGFGPANEQKKINAIFVYPDLDFLYMPVSNFLHEIGSCFQACNLGEHSSGETLPNHPRGQLRIVPRLESSNYNSKELRDKLNSLGRHLGSLRQKNGNTVLYILNTGPGDETVPFLCNEFLRFFESYQHGLGKDGTIGHNDLVLQIIPIDLIFQKDKLVIPTSFEYKRISFEVYDRCAPTRTANIEALPPYRSASAIQLSRPIPQSLDFKLSSDPRNVLTAKGDCLHLAYKWQSDQQWLVASWTDNYGTRQWNAAYWIGDDDDRGRLFQQVAIETLRTSLEILKPSKTLFQLFVVKDGQFEDYERIAWMAIRDRLENHVELSIFRIDLTPPLSLRPAEEEGVGVRQNLNSVQTPLSQSAAVSPEVISQSPSQGGGSFNDGASNAKLINVLDESWIVLVDYKNSPKNGPQRASSGVLFKRAGAADQDGVLPFQLDIIHGLGDPSSLLKLALRHYANLAILARLRHITDPISGVLPIHVAAARKSYTTLINTMRYD